MKMYFRSQGGGHHGLISKRKGLVLVLAILVWTLV